MGVDVGWLCAGDAGAAGADALLLVSPAGVGGISGLAASSVSRRRLVPREELSFRPSEVAFIRIWCLHIIPHDQLRDTERSKIVQTSFSRFPTRVQPSPTPSPPKSQSTYSPLPISSTAPSPRRTTRPGFLRRPQLWR